MSVSLYPERLNSDQAQRVFAVLVEHAGAHPSKASDFRIALTAERPPREFRFSGNLGFGGKLRFPALTVDCYPEDENDANLIIVARTNEQLAALRNEFQSTSA